MGERNNFWLLQEVEGRRVTECTITEHPKGSAAAFTWILQQVFPGDACLVPKKPPVFGSQNSLLDHDHTSVWPPVLVGTLMP